MLPLPKTPTKSGKADQIEQLKQSLCAKWGLQLPVRDSTWSPSRRHRDPNRLEEKIASVIHFLYHKEGALKFAIDRFEQNAIKVVSEWQFKPHADISVIPTQDPSKSILQADFLRKRNALSNEAIRELTESLLQHLGQIADRVKAGEIFPKADEADSERFSTALQNKYTDWYFLKTSRFPLLKSTREQNLKSVHENKCP